MLIPIILLHLAAVVQQSLEQGTLSKITAEKQKEILDKHNAIRRAVQPTASNMMKMTWSEKATESAKKRAEKCTPNVRLKEERTVDGIVCGENALQSSSSYPWSKIIQMWQKKSSNFQYGVGAIGPKKDIYSYTQIIWHNSHQIGCGLAYCESGNSPMYLYVCHYCPRGNLIQQIATPYTEGLPCGDCPNNCEDKLCTNPCTYVDLKTDCEAIIDLFSCDIPEFEQQCQATCKCKTEMDID
ncbi:cysteine-rich venom protein kaouthin-2-like [Sceloporus undulatus]|uniref:cysteine-rich venom protein kaouthin-2-like n=1 Tax=Sceloporus undulatus TaxID=8520 RepID=UPI001C4C7C63|nr:cysteine-rich venom protein kaouthin-2-like [Sceloporus undulatus]